MRILIVLGLLGVAARAGDFVLIHGGEVRPGSAWSRVDDFEMAVHPVTNAEYLPFVAATRHAAPLHWNNGQIPLGMERYPVIFVNRFDVDGYLRWRSRTEHRIYRLPTASEFELAARGGARGGTYPWGKDAPEGKANYDANGQRTFAEWRKLLKPVASYPPNPFGLFDMAGNVWQMVNTIPDEALASYKYRVENPVSEENSLAGGSWARSEYYLRCGVRGGASSGIRHPDIGFRVVREPAGATHFERQPRRLLAAAAGDGTIFLGWQLVAADAPGTGFHVYRTLRRDTAGERITTAPLTAATNYVDRGAPREGNVYYRVRAVESSGKEGPPSEWARADASAKRSNLVAVYEPTVKQGGFVPIFGDLDGDGRLDVVIRLDNGIKEMSRDPGVPVELEALNADGRALWRRPLVHHDHAFGNANNVPVVVYDLDGDGKAEVICRLQEGDKVYLAVLDGMTGNIRRKTPWTDMATDFAKSSTRIHLSVAYLDGKTPALVTQTGLYENEIFDAFDANLRKLWQFRSFAETNGSGSHHIDIADVDGDGRDEVFDGTTLLNPDGTVRWSIYREHPDIVAIKHILPGVKDRQVFYAVESNVHAGAYLVDAKTGKIQWKVNREDDPRWTHAHMGWVADIWEGSPGMEMLTNRDGHTAADTVLFAADGKIIVNPFPRGWRPVNWTGGAVRDLLSSDGRRLGKFNGKGIDEIAGAPVADGPRTNCIMTADLVGDYRDEVVCTADNKLLVFSNIEAAPRREVTRTASREYRQWMARNMGGGYPSYFEWEK
jgi:rhamnogalacturonan endolyase